MDNEKLYSIKMEPRDGYLYTVVSGNRLTAAISAEYWKEIAAKCAEVHLHKILIEKDFKESVTVDQMLKMADHLATLLPEHLIAFVDRFGHQDVNELGKRIVRNRHVLLQIFEDAETAERWLNANG
ncbi:MAG: hypothetical protein ABI878_02185 [Acidobacteriota bacterium]